MPGIGVWGRTRASIFSAVPQDSHIMVYKMVTVYPLCVLLLWQSGRGLARAIDDGRAKGKISASFSQHLVCVLLQKQRISCIDNFTLPLTLTPGGLTYVYYQFSRRQGNVMKISTFYSHPENVACWWCSCMVFAGHATLRSCCIYRYIVFLKQGSFFSFIFFLFMFKAPISPLQNLGGYLIDILIYLP